MFTCSKASRLGSPATLGLFAVVLALLIAFATAASASAHALIPAHAKLTHADPAPGAVLATAPTTVTLTFAEEMKPGESTVKVYDDHGTQVSDDNSVSIPSNDLKAMKVTMHGTDSETYVVVYHNVSADDGDAYTGAYQFTVSKEATPSAGQQPDQSGGTSTPGSGGGVQPLIAALIGLVALVVGAGGGYYFARSQAAH